MNGRNVRPCPFTHSSSLRYFCCPHTTAGSQFSFSCGSQSPRSSRRIRASLPARARAIVPPPAPLPMITMSKWLSVTDDLFHQPMIVQCAFETHLRLTPRPDCGREVLVHRTISADVTPAGVDDAGNAAVVQHDCAAVGLESDHSTPTVEFRDAHAAHQR